MRITYNYLANYSKLSQIHNFHAFVIDLKNRLFYLSEAKILNMFSASFYYLPSIGNLKK